MNRFDILGHEILLAPEGALFLTSTATLIAADVHLGKSAAFRSHGLPVPEGDTARDLQRLTDLVRRFSPKELIIAGDLFHAPSGITPEVEEEISRFISGLGIPFHLVTGNHDAKIHRLPASIIPVAALDRGGVRIIHDPQDASGDALHLAGHWHPVAKIRDGKRTSLRLPCFFLRGNTFVLPAFGSFTGGTVMHPQAGHRIFVPLREQVVEVPRELWK